MVDEFGPKKYTYKISGESYLSSYMSNTVAFLNQVDGVIPTSIKVYGYIGDKCKFKFKGTELQLRELINALGNKLEFTVETVRKVLF